MVRQDKAETAPSEVAVVDLATGEQTRRSSPPSRASGGSWALTAGDLYYPTLRRRPGLLPGHQRPRRRQRRGRLVRPGRHRLLRAHRERARRRHDDLRRRPPGRLPHRQPPRRQRPAAAGRGPGRLHRPGTSPPPPTARVWSEVPEAAPPGGGASSAPRPTAPTSTSARAPPAPRSPAATRSSSSATRRAPTSRPG